MKIKPKHFIDWQKRCEALQEASEALDRNQHSIHRQEYLCAYRREMRRCVLVERRM